MKPTSAGEAFRDLYGLWKRKERVDAFNLTKHIKEQDLPMLTLWKDVNNTRTYPTNTSNSVKTLAKIVEADDKLKCQLNAVRAGCTDSNFRV